MRKQPLHFRKDEMNYIMRRWQAGESCSLVGVGSIGKSNLLHHLSDEEVQQHYLGHELAEKSKPIIIDPNMLGALPVDHDTPDFRSWAGYELMMHRLYLTFYPFDMLGEEGVNFYNAYQALQDGTNPLFKYMGLRYLELGLDFFLRRGYRLIFLFDEFESLLQTMPTHFFQTLRGLRDMHKSQMVFLTFSRQPLNTLVAQFGLDQQAMEPFTELFTDHVLYVSAYNQTDSLDMIQRLMERHQKQYATPIVDLLLYASGGYAGLLRSSFRVIESVGQIDQHNNQSEAVIRRLATRRGVQTECDTLWHSLSATEHKLLLSLPNLTREDMTPELEEAIALLVRKGILRADSQTGSVSIEPPLFRAYVDMKK